MQKVLIDCDVVLDLLLDREPFAHSAQQLFVLLEKEKLTGYVSPLIFSNVFFILRKAFSQEKAIQLLQKFRTLVDVVVINESVVDLALASDFKDFEDAMQYYTACKADLDVILTRNVKDYKHAKLPVMDAEGFLQLFFAH